MLKNPWHDGTFWRSACCLLIAAALVTEFLFDVYAGPNGSQPRLAFAGDADSFQTTAISGGTGLHHALWVDMGFLVSFGLGGALIVLLARSSGCVPRYRFSALRDPAENLPIWLCAVPVAAAVLDLIENVLCLIAGQDGKPSWLAPAVTTVAWWKVLAYLVAGAILLTLLYDVAMPHELIAIARPTLSFMDHLPWTGTHVGTSPAPATATAAPPPTSDIAICVSGGGIRAASVAHGALRRFDEPQGTNPSLFKQARWLASVSGGGYTAAGWAVSRFSGFPTISPAPSGVADGLLTAKKPYAETVRHRRQYLYNGKFGLTGGVLLVLVRTIASLSALGSIAVILGFGGGELVRSWALCRPDSGKSIDGCSAWHVRTAAPGLTLAAIAVLLILVALAITEESRRKKVFAVGAGVAGAAAILLVLTLALPAAVNWLHGHPQLVGGKKKSVATTGAALLAALVGVLKTQATSLLKRYYARLGGVLLAALLLLLLLAVATARADNAGYLNWLLVAAFSWVAIVSWLPAHRFTLNGLYRKRLSETFALRQSGSGLEPISYSEEPLSEQYTTSQDTPELVMYLTQHSRKTQPGGVRAAGVTVDRHGVTSYLSSVPPDAADSVSWARYPIGSWWSGFPRGWIVTRAMATSGAAFGSAMGRSSLGTTNALLAAMNLRTGIWIPNPVRRNDYWPANARIYVRSPRVGFGYFLKEVLGLYSPERDPFIFVSDGGHLENLGLVAILPKKPSKVYVVDASGDKPGTFSTLREALDLAKTKLGIDISLDWRKIQKQEWEALPKDCVVKGDITYWDGTQGKIYYGRYQPCMTCPPELLAYASSDKRFPYYALTHQSLSEEQFDHLVEMGEHVAARLMTL